MKAQLNIRYWLAFQSLRILLQEMRIALWGPIVCESCYK